MELNGRPALFDIGQTVNTCNDLTLRPTVDEFGGNILWPYLKSGTYYVKLAPYSNGLDISDIWIRLPMVLLTHNWRCSRHIESGRIYIPLVF